MRRFGIVVGVVLLATAWAWSGSAQDGIELQVKQDSSGATVLTWSGGTPGFQVFRSTAPTALTRPENRLADTNSRSFTESGAPAAPVLFYLVTSSPAGTLVVSEASAPEPCAPPLAKDYQIEAEWSSPYGIRSVEILRSGGLLAVQPFDCPPAAHLAATVSLVPTDQIQTKVTLCSQEPEAALTDEITGCGIADAGYLAVDAAPGNGGETRVLRCTGAPAASSWVRIQSGNGDLSPADHGGADYPISALRASSALDDLTISRFHIDSDGDRSESKAGLTVFQFQLKSLAFGGTGFFNVTTDQDGLPFPEPHWLDADLDGDADGSADHTWPVAFQRGTVPAVRGLTFAVTPPDLPVCDVLIEGTGWSGESFSGSGRNGNGELRADGDLVSNLPLPDTVTYVAGFAIGWTVRYADGAKTPAGRGENRLYVVLDQPLGDGRESYFDISTKAADGSSTAHQAFYKLWDDFKDLHVENARGQRLGYYRGVVCPGELVVYDAPSLVTFTNGQCGAWADLLRQCARTLGIDGTEYVTIEPDPAVLPRDCSMSDVPPGILIKNQEILGTGTTGCTHYPFRYNDPCGNAKPWSAGTVEVLDALGLPGQDEPNPTSYFSRHFIVKFNLEYFDPSYGTGPFTGTKDQANLEWETQGLSGFWACGAFFPDFHYGVRKDRPAVRETFFNK